MAAPQQAAMQLNTHPAELILQLLGLPILGM
jgi:hypothetical protein